MQARALFASFLLALGVTAGAPAHSQTAPTLPPPPGIPLPAVPAELSAVLKTGSPAVWNACSAATSAAFLLSVGAAIANPIGIPIPPEASALLASSGAYVSAASTPCYLFPQPNKAQVCGTDAEFTAVPFIVITPSAVVVSQLDAVERALNENGVPAGSPISQAVADAMTCKPAAPPIQPPENPGSGAGSDDTSPSVEASDGDSASAGGADFGSSPGLTGGSDDFARATDGVLPDGSSVDALAAPQTALGVDAAAAEQGSERSPLTAVLTALAVFVGLLLLSNRMGSGAPR